MNKVILKISEYILLGLFIFNTNLFANEQIDLKNSLLNKIDKVGQIVKDQNLSKEQRNTEILNVLTPMFDFKLMARLSLGRTFKKLKESDKERFVNLYVERMKQSYSSKLDAYSDEKVKVKEIKQPKKNRIYIITDLISDDEKLEIVYKFYKSKEQLETKNDWLIYDIEISGISILRTDKIQFREYLQTKSIYELMNFLENKNK